MKKTFRIILILLFFAALFTSGKAHVQALGRGVFGDFLDALPINFYVKVVASSQDNNCNDINKEIPILMFHNVAPLTQHASSLSKSLTIKPELFSEMMDYLAKNNFTPITLKELNDIWQSKTAMPKKPIVLTFDDGDYGVYKYAYPVLREKNFHFVVFLITRYLNKHTSFYMNKNDVLEMLDSRLCEVGSHTRDHVNLKKCYSSTMFYEISTSTSDIKKSLHYVPTSFCYPFGGFTNASIKVLEKYGYNMATTGIPGFASKNQNHLLLKRIRIDGRDPLSEFVHKVGN
jgi:peptidoglycan/xylan/chitin deacetylase (PgdA/CDA1 family)